LDKIAGILLISLLAIVSITSLSYYIVSQPNQTQNPPSPTPTPTSIPTLTPAPTPTSSPLALKPANLVTNCNLEAGFYEARIIDGKEVPSIRVNGTITNIGEETAYNITLHVKAWFSNGTQSFATDLPLIWAVLMPPPFLRPSIKGDDTLVITQNDLSGILSVPDDVKGTDWTNATAYSDCISSYQITATWD